MSNRFNFSPVAKPDKPKLATPVPLQPISSGDATDKLKAAMASTQPGEKIQLPPSITPSDAAQISQMTLPTDDYEWDGQVFENPEEATNQMQVLLGQLANAFGGDGTDTALYRCLHFLDKHTFLKDILAPEDVGVMMRGLAISSAAVVDTKTKNRKKTAKKQEDKIKMANAVDDIDLGV